MYSVECGVIRLLTSIEANTLWRDVDRLHHTRFYTMERSATHAVSRCAADERPQVEELKSTEFGVKLSDSVGTSIRHYHFDFSVCFLTGWRKPRLGPITCEQSLHTCASIFVSGGKLDILRNRISNNTVKNTRNMHIKYTQ